MSPEHSQCPLNVVLAGTTGIPGKQILAALQELKVATAANPASRPITLTVLKRTVHNTATPTDPANADLRTLFVDYDDGSTLEAALREADADVVVSALHAEPSPALDDTLLSAVIAYHSSSGHTTPPLFVSGYTLDVLHPDAMALATKDFLGGKIALAHRLQDAAAVNAVRYTTLVTAGFLDYILAKGYTGIDLVQRTARLFDGGVHRATGCTLDFVGAAVAEVVRDAFYGDGTSPYINARVRLAETAYSGLELLEIAQRVVGGGGEWPITYVDTDDRVKEGKRLLEAGEPGKAVSCFFSKLVWGGTGAACFDDGLAAMPTLKRRGRQDIVAAAAEEARSPKRF